MFYIVAQETSEILDKTTSESKAHKIASDWHKCHKFNGQLLPVIITTNKQDGMMMDNAIAEYSCGEFSFNVRY